MNRADCINHLRAGHPMTHRVSRIIADMLEADGKRSHLGATEYRMARDECTSLSKRVDALLWLREVEQAGGSWLAKRYRKIGRRRYDCLVTQHRVTHTHALKEAGV